MSSLWTPDGERRVNQTSADSPASSGDDAADRDFGDADNDPELLEELAKIEQQLLDTPIESVIANHCYGFFQLAALNLGQSPPRLGEAQLAIDALGGVVETLGARLGDSEPTLRDGLAQLRLAFVQIAGAAALTEDEDDPNPAG